MFLKNWFKWSTVRSIISSISIQYGLIFPYINHNLKRKYFVIMVITLFLYISPNRIFWKIWTISFIDDIVYIIYNVLWILKEQFVLFSVYLDKTYDSKLHFLSTFFKTLKDVLKSDIIYLSWFLFIMFIGHSSK